MAETLYEWELSLAAQVAAANGRDGARRGGADPLDALAAIDPVEAARFGLRFLVLPEVKTLAPADFALGDRMRAAHQIVLRGLAGLSLGEMTDALVRGALYVDWTVRWNHPAFAFLADHPALATPAARLHVLRAAVAAQGWTGAPVVPWLLERLIEDPVPDAGDWLFAAWREHRGDALFDSLLAQAVIATGLPEGVAAIAATLDSEAPSAEAVVATLCLDPTTATDRLGHLLVLDPTGPRPLGSSQLLHALAADGLRAGEITGNPSRRPRGWVRADPRWVPLLLAVRSHADPNVSLPARKALGHADPTAVAAAKPKPKGKAGKALRLRAIGSTPFTSAAYWGDALWTAEGRVACFTAERRIEVRRYAEGFPVEATFDLPEGLALPTEARDPYDDGWDRLGIHGVALHPQRARLALSSCATDEALSGVLLLDADGGVIARWRDDALLPHRLHWGGAGTTLWVLAEGEGATVVALDPESLAERGRCAIGEFPPPAFPSAFRHPTDDVACFQIACGQDGLWVKCVEPTARRPKLRAQKLSAVHHDSLLFGLAEDGAAAVTLLETKLLLRDWPTMKPRKGKVLAGSAEGAAGARHQVLVAVATAGTAPDRFEVFRLPTGDKAGEGAWPDGHVLQDAFEDFVLTTQGAVLHLSHLA